MSKSTKYTCERCGITKWQLKAEPRKHCHKCAKAIEQLSANLSTRSRTKAHSFQEYSSDNILQDLNWFVRKCNDLGSSGPVTSISPGHPMFEQIAKQCTPITRICR